MNREKISYIVGLLLNLFGFFIGSNILIQSISKFLVPKSEYQAYLLWCVLGLLMSWIGNIVGILLISHKNVIRTIIGSVLGLAIGLSLSFIPLLFIGGIVSIFLGSLIGHHKNG
jgi:prepilin signal peptidase PulO-like enzyme (type II secretory pathway)